MKKNILPTARKSNLVVQEADNELLVYDTDRHKAFCLNDTLRLILEQCDGKTTFGQASANIKKILKTDLDDQIFWMALGQLKRNRLLNESEPIPEIPKVSRRDLIMSTMALGISLPTVFALGVSPPQGLTSVGQCVPGGETCIIDSQNNTTNCCPGLACSNEAMCCVILTGLCDQSNDFCCPGTVCGSTNSCCIAVNFPCDGPAPNGNCCPGLVCMNGACTNTA